MLEEKYVKKGNLVKFVGEDSHEFTNGEIYEIREDGLDAWGNVPVSLDDEGFTYNGHNQINFEIVQEKKFDVGSEWVAKCDIATYKFDTKFAWISKGETITLSYVIWDILIFNDYSYVLSEESAKLLLEPYVEPLREMTAEQIAKKFKVKVVGL